MTSVSNARKLATWHAIVHTLDALIVTIMDTLQWISLTEYHLQACQHDAEITALADMTDQHLRIVATPGILTTTIETGTDSANLDPTHITPDLGVTVIVILTEAILDHFIDLHAIAPYVTGVPAHTATIMTHHITDPHHADISPEMTVDPECINPTGNTTKPTQRSSSSSYSTPWKPKDRRHKQVTIDDPPSEYYSSDEQDSDSEDDLN